MNDNRQILNEQAREEYSTPSYRRFAFESSDLIQASTPEPPKGSVACFLQDGANDVAWD